MFPDSNAVNAGTVTIITALADGAKSVFAAGLARVLDEKDTSCASSRSWARDRSRTLSTCSISRASIWVWWPPMSPEFYKIQCSADITDRLQSIMKHYNDEIHIIAPTEMARAASQYGQTSLTDLKEFRAKQGRPICPRRRWLSYTRISRNGIAASGSKVRTAF
jgi:hypothetical protein